jgi:hypothetical protein
MTTWWLVEYRFFGLLGDRVVAGGHQGAVHDEHSVLAEPLARPEREQGTEMPDGAVGRGLWDPEQRGELPQCQVRAPVRGDQQNPVLELQPPGPALADRVRALTPQRGDQLAELP